MSSIGSLVFYGKKGLSDPFTLSYGKTTIGSTPDNHIRIKGNTDISCVLDTNEFGVTTLVNENDNDDICINEVPTKKYTIMKDGDHLEIGKIKFKYLNPTLSQTHLEQTQQTLNKKYGVSENIKMRSGNDTNPPTPLKRLQNLSANKRRFSTGSKLPITTSTLKLSKKSTTSTPQSASKLRFSQRMIERRNSTLATMKENEELDFVVSPIVKNKLSNSRNNKTFSGNSHYSSPIPSKNRTYSGNISDVSEHVTTPENTLTAASITPLNVSKRTKKSMNRSKSVSYVDFPEYSSTPRSIMKVNRSSSLYRPLVEDITPASPLPRSSLRNSSFKKAAFTQRRSVNFNTSIASNDSTDQDFEKSETSLSRKRKSIESESQYTKSPKKSKISSSKELDNEDSDRNSIHSNLSGIHNLSDTSFGSSKHVATSNKSKDEANGSFQEVQSMVSWQEEMSKNDPISMLESTNCSLDTSLSSRSTSLKLGRSKTRSKSLGLESRSKKSTDKLSKTLGNQLELGFSNERVGDNSTSSTSTVSNIDLPKIGSNSSHLENRSRRSKTELSKASINDLELSFSNERGADSSSQSSTSRISNIGISTTISDSLQLKNDMRKSTTDLSKAELNNLESDSDKADVDGSSQSSRSRHSNINLPKLKTRSKSLHLVNKSTKSLNKLSKTLANCYESSFLKDKHSVASSSSSRSNRSLMKVKTNTRSKSLNLETEPKKCRDKFSKTLGDALSSFLERESDVSVLDESLESSHADNISSSTPLVRKRSKSAGAKTPSSKTKPTMDRTLSASQTQLFGNSTRQSFNISPIKDCPRSIRSRNPPKSLENSTKEIFGSLTDVSLSEYNESTNKLYESSTLGRASKRCSLKNSSMPGKRLEVSTRANSVMSLRSNSIVTSRDSESSMASSFQEEKNISVLKAIFKTPGRKTPSKNLQTPKDSSDVRSAERLLKRTLRNTPMRSTPIALKINEESLDALETSTSLRDEENEDLNVSKKTSENDRRTSKRRNTFKNDLNDVASARELLENSNLRSTPKIIIHRVQSSPRNDLTDVRGLKNLLKTPKVQKSPKNDLTKIVGVRRLLKTPKLQKSPQNDLTRVDGVKKLLKTPKVQKSPRNDLTKIVGVKRLLKTPKIQKSPQNDLTCVNGVKKLLKTPKVQKSPRNDLTNIEGVKNLMKSPRLPQKSPKNDLTDIKGVKRLMKSPILQKSPKNDLTNVKGVKKMFTTPKAQKEPKNELLDVRGIKQLLRTPKNKSVEESHDLSGIDLLFDEKQNSLFDTLLDKKPPRTYGKSPISNKSQKSVQQSQTPDHVLKWIEDQSELMQIPAEKSNSRRGKRKLDQSSEHLTPNKKHKNSYVTDEHDKTVELNISTNISKKPASTPVLSKTEISTLAPKNNSKSGKIDSDKVQQTKIKRKIEKTENQLSPRKTRARVGKTEHKKLDESNKNTVEKTAGTRQDKMKQNNIEVSHMIEETNTKARKGNKQKEIVENVDTIEGKPMKRTRGKKDISSNISVDNSRCGEKVKNNEDKLTKKSNKPTETEIVDTAPKTRGRKKKELGESENVGDTKKGRKNSKKEIGTDMTNAMESSYINKEKDNSTNINIEEKPKTRGRKKNKVDENIENVVVTDKRNTKKIIEDKETKSTNKRGRKREDENTIEDELEISAKKMRTNRMKKAEESFDHENELPVKKNRTKKETDSKKEEQRKETPVKKSRIKQENVKTEQVEQTRNTRSNKGKNTKYDDSEWDTQANKNGDKRAVRFRDTVQLLETPVQEKSSSGRTLRKRK